jgi:hypothetical protein
MLVVPSTRGITTHPSLQYRAIDYQSSPRTNRTESLLREYTIIWGILKLLGPIRDT